MFNPLICRRFNPKLLARLVNLLPLLLVFCASLPVLGGEEIKVIGRTIPDFQDKTIEGKRWRLRVDEEKRLTVVAFLGAECPLAGIYGTKLEQLREQFGPEKLRFLGVMSNWQDDEKDVEQYVQEAGLSFPVIHDSQGKLADRFGATRTPEFFVLDASGKVRYHGRFDDQFSPGGQTGRCTARRFEIGSAGTAGRQGRFCGRDAGGRLHNRSSSASSKFDLGHLSGCGSDSPSALCELSPKRAGRTVWNGRVSRSSWLGRDDQGAGC